MNRDEVIRLALEALEQSETFVPYEGFGMARREAERKHQAAINALRAALAEPQEPSEMVLVPRELLERASESLGAFVSDHGWAQADMDVMDDIDWTLAASCAHPAPQRQPTPDLMTVVEWILDAGHMNQELLAQLRAAWEAAHGIKGEQK